MEVTECRGDVFVSVECDIGADMQKDDVGKLLDGTRSEADHVLDVHAGVAFVLAK
jgi:hypothetical protein